MNSKQDIYKPCLNCGTPVNISMILIQQRTNSIKNIFCVGSTCGAKYLYYEMRLRVVDEHLKKFYPEIRKQLFNDFIKQKKVVIEVECQ